MNKEFVLIGFMLIFYSTIKAQIINNENFVITNGTSVVLTNNLQNNATGNVNHSGSIRMSGNLINNGTFTGNTGSLIRMQGTTEQQVSGNSVVNISDFQIDNSGNGVSVSNTGALRISNQLQLTNGRLFTSNASPVRFTTTATNPSETNANHIMGTAIMESRAIGVGALGTFLNFSMAAGGNVGNVELTRRSGDGTTTTGGFNPTQGFAIIGGFESVDVHWIVDATNNGSRDITFSWLSAWDNGKNLIQMQLWRTNSPFTTSSPWVLKTTGTVNMSGRTHTANAPLNELRNGWTVSDLLNPLPLDLIAFNVRLLQGKDTEISWFTHNEINLSHYILERSTDNIHFEVIHTQKANNQTENRYQQLDFNAKDLGKEVLYYRLIQVESNGLRHTMPTKSVIFNKPFYAGIYPNPFTQDLNIKIYNPESQIIHLSITDNLGRELYKVDLSEKYIDFQPTKYLKDISVGVYFLKVSYNTQTELFKIIKN